MNDKTLEAMAHKMVEGVRGYVSKVAEALSRDAIARSDAQSKRIADLERRLRMLESRNE